MTRVGFDFLGRPTLDNSANGPNTLWTILCFWIFVNLALFSAYNFKWSQGMELSMADLGALAFVNVSYLLFADARGDYFDYLVSMSSLESGLSKSARESIFPDTQVVCGDVNTTMIKTNITN